MRGYFGIGIEGISKSQNAGALFRTANAFGASFVFTVAAAYEKAAGNLADTSKVAGQVPFYAFPSLEAMVLPQGCELVGIELTPDAVELPSFTHPRAAAYVLGRERGSLTPGMLARCSHVVKIPTRFCINLGLAGAVVMYDRLTVMGRFHPRPLVAGGPPESFGPLVERFRGLPPAPGHPGEE
ncbi:MAG: RNA methyltransferase [Magnetospirillum sp. WYHS-4]